MITLVAFLCLGIGLLLGYHYRKLVDTVNVLSERIKPQKRPAPEPIIFDPYDLSTQVRLEHEDKMRKLNDL